MSNLNMILAGFALFIAIGVGSSYATGVTEHPLETICKQFNYNEGTCYATVDAFWNEKNSRRCLTPIKCTAKDHMSGNYIVHTVSASSNGVPCGVGKNSAVLGCDNGVCSKVLTQYQNRNSITPPSFHGCAVYDGVAWNTADS